LMVTSPFDRTKTRMTSSRKPVFRFKSLLFAKPRPSASLGDEEEGDDDHDDDLDFADEEEEDEEEEYEDDDVDEIGSVDDDDEDEEEEELYEEEEEEDVVEAEYEEYYDEEEAEGEYEEDEEEYYDEDDYELEEEEAAVTADGSIDIWASYNVANEEEPTPLLDDVESDPFYKQAKEAVLSQVAERKRLEEMEKKIPRNLENMEALDKMMEHIANMSDQERKIYDEDPVIQEVERIVHDNKMLLTEEDIKELIIQDEDGNDIIDPKAIAEAGSFADMQGPDAFPSDDPANPDGENLIYPSNRAIQPSDLVDLDNAIKSYHAARDQLENQTFFGSEHTMAYMDVERDWNALSNETQDEILTLIEYSNTMACPEPEMWLMYDLNFNVTNLILASFRHNPEAPILFTQWMPQLEVYEKYADQRERGFQWTWNDVEAADVNELKKYYHGIGYDSIPKKESSETGIITLDESPMDDEEREMMALENWMDEVFNEESENLMFDDENFEPRDNVFDEDYGSSSTDGTSAVEEKFMKEFEAFEREFSEESQEWRDQFATVERYEYKDDPEGQKEFRGHLVVACPPEDDDLKLAEKITERFGEEFGKAVFVETRVLGHARPQDNVFEVWLESYEIDLLHSKRQAFINSKVWKGPSEVDDEQLEYLVDRVKYLISDEHRYSYRMSDFSDIKA